jgi:hypothetical protein
VKLGLLVVLAACSAPSKAVSPPIEHRDSTPPTDDSFVARLVIDAEPGGKRFQGVWLEHGGERWVVDYRATGVWKPFDGLDVRVTGERWTPDPRAQAIQAPHFKVARLEVADRKQAKRFFAIGPEREVTGSFVSVAGEPGSKSEGSTIHYFETEDRRYEIAGGEPGSGRSTATVRDVEINPAWAATRGGPFIWVLDHRAID